MPAQIKDIKLTVRDLLRGAWSNTGLPASLASDDIHVGWFNDGKGFPQVSVTHDEDGAHGGGVTGYSGISSDGTGGVQQRTGTVLVTAWAGSRDDYSSAGEAQLQAEEMSWVIEDAINSNQAPGDLQTLAVDRRTRLVDDEVSPPEHAVQFEVRYTWMKTPP